MKTFKTSILGGAFFTLVAASATVATTSSYAVPAYDGLWSVSIITEKGDCDRGYRYPIRIQNGALASAGSVTAITINGKVQPTGAITVIVSAGSKSASGSGRLSGGLGGGAWTRG